MNGMKTALVIVELINGKPPAVSLELLALARALSAGGTAVALAPGADTAVAQTLIAHGADKVYFSAGTDRAEYNGDSWVDCAERLARELNPAVILAAHNSSGADLVPRLAFRSLW